MIRNTSRFYPATGYENAAANCPHISSAQPAASVQVYNRAGEQVPLPKSQYGKLAKYRMITTSIGKISTAGLRNGPVPDSWLDLYDLTTDFYLDAIQANRKRAPLDYRIALDAEIITTAALSGFAQKKAFLAVIPEVMAHISSTETKASLLAIARRSKGFIIKGAALDDEADAGISYGVSYPKPALESADYKRHLRYSPAWFTPIEPDGAIGLNAQAMPLLRSNHHKSPNAAAKPTDIWFGCPAYLIIPGAYDAMTTLADRGDLFMQSYHP